MPKVTQLVTFKGGSTVIRTQHSLRFSPQKPHWLLERTGLSLWVGSVCRSHNGHGPLRVVPLSPTPTLLSHCCIHRWRGCDRTARRAHRLRSACGRTSPRSPLCTCRGGRPRHRPPGYRTLRQGTGILREKAERHTGLGGQA